MRHFDSSFEPDLDAEGLRFAVVVSRYNRDITDALLDGAVQALKECGATDEDVMIASVPGAFEIPIAIQAMLEDGDFDAALALGCVIRGETPHFEYVAGQCAQGVMAVALDTQVPVAFGVLTTDNLEQALARAGADEANKGREAALTAVEMANLVQGLGG